MADRQDQPVEQNRAGWSAGDGIETAWCMAEQLYLFPNLLDRSKPYAAFKTFL